MEKLIVQPADRGARLDVWLAGLHPEHSRSQWKRLILSGQVLVDGQVQKPHHTLTGAETVEYEIPPPEPVDIEPEAIPLDILFEDGDIIVINKPPGLVVHPAPGHTGGTLVNALLHHCRDLAGIGGELRPGIVHRLDKDTSGVLVIAKNEEAMADLADQFKRRTVRKTYTALVWGHPEREQGTIDAPVGRHPQNRKKMTTSPRVGRAAVTHYRVVERFKLTSLLDIRIETGRTHQIRVHMAHEGHPIVGDQQYGRRDQRQLPRRADRQLLHAHTLSFRHPGSGEELEIEAPLPPDMHAFIRDLREK